MSDLHNLLSSRMNAFLDKHNTSAMEWVWCTRQNSTVCPHLCTALSCCWGHRHCLHVCVCVCVLRSGISNLLLGSNIWLHFHTLGHSKTSSLTQCFQSSLESTFLYSLRNISIEFLVMLWLIVSHRDLNPLSKSDCPQQSHLSQNGTIWQNKGITNPFTSNYWGCFLPQKKNSL